MTQDNKPAELSKRANMLKEATCHSVAKAWVKEHYAPPLEASPELDAAIVRMDEQDDSK